MLPRLRRLADALRVIRQIAEEASTDLLAIMVVVKRLVFEVVEFGLFLYALWLIFRRH
jgi:hypothetical protein